MQQESYTSRPQGVTYVFGRGVGPEPEPEVARQDPKPPVISTMPPMPVLADARAEWENRLLQAIADGVRATADHLLETELWTLSKVADELGGWYARMLADQVRSTIRSAIGKWLDAKERG